MSYSESVFFIPVSFENFESFTTNFSQSGLWKNTPEECYTPRYFLNYILNIAKDKTAFRSYCLEKPFLFNLYMFEDKIDMPFSPMLEDVRFSCFSTGVGFLEFWIKYKDASPENITDFSYRFKKAIVRNLKGENDKKSLYDVAKSILPDDLSVQLFFTAATEFKHECHCYHFLHIDKAPENHLSDKWLFSLKRSYRSDFGMPEESDGDMIYKPYFNDQWGGSSEGLVNITYDVDNDETDRYLHEFKYSHLRIDYYFLYLLLLNQRFTCIKYITGISRALKGTQKELEELNKKIVELKTVFAFNIVSDDQIFQNVYSKMYNILGIERLLEDILDNEAQIEILRNASAAKAEKLSSRLLFGISLLSIFSALVDASSYFERFDTLSAIATMLGLICTAAVVLISVVWIMKTKNTR